MSMRWDGGVCGMWGAKPRVLPSFPDTLRATPSQGARAFGALLQWYGTVANHGSPETCDLGGSGCSFLGGSLGHQSALGNLLHTNTGSCRPLLALPGAIRSSSWGHQQGLLGQKG